MTTLPHFKCYIEPFIGGGAGFFAIRPPRAILSDVNPELIELYEAMKVAPKDLRECLSRHQAHHSEQYFYKVRSVIPDDRIERAARTLYLNRTCWNGLYRLNQAGDFNVPIGTKTKVILPSDNFEFTAKLLKVAEILQSDFEPVIDRAVEGDLIFIDPPYTVRHNMNGFVKYNERIFSWADQVRLQSAVARASGRGAAIIVTNADHTSVRQLYEGIGLHETINRASVISGKSSGRTITSELLVRL